MIVDRAGQTRHVESDEKFRITKDVYPKGTVDEKVTIFTYDPTIALLASVTDPLGRATTLTYDAKGNATTATYLVT